VVGNYTMTATNTHRSSGVADDLMGVEAVLADGTIFETGSKAFSSKHKTMGWHFASNTFPNIKNLFMDACGTLGVITKAAVRIYPQNETRILPLGAFEDYATALEFMRRIARANLVQHVCSWHWALYSIIDHLGTYGRGSPADVLIYDPWKKPDDRPYMIVAPTMSGYKEDMDGHQKAVERILKDLGGRLYNDECQKRFPGAWKFLKDHYMDHQPTTQFMGGFGEAFPMMPMVISDPLRVAALEEWGLKFLRNSPLKLGLTYYSHCLDQGRSFFLRMTPFISPDASKAELARAAKTRLDYLDEAYEKYGSIPVRYDYGRAPGAVLEKTGGHAKVLRAIKRALDPMNIMNPGLSVSMYGLKK
jgi:FAD/FMN-containing dehydrogenase